MAIPAAALIKEALKIYGQIKGLGGDIPSTILRQIKADPQAIEMLRKAVNRDVINLQRAGLKYSSNAWLRYLQGQGFKLNASGTIPKRKKKYTSGDIENMIKFLGSETHNVKGIKNVWDKKTQTLINNIRAYAFFKPGERDQFEKLISSLNNSQLRNLLKAYENVIGVNEYDSGQRFSVVVSDIISRANSIKSQSATYVKNSLLSKKSLTNISGDVRKFLDNYNMNDMSVQEAQRVLQGMRK